MPAPLLLAAPPGPRTAPRALPPGLALAAAPSGDCANPVPIRPQAACACTRGGRRAAGVARVRFRDRGAPVRAENTPVEPDPGHAGEGSGCVDQSRARQVFGG